MAISRQKAAELREQYLLKREELLQGRVDILASKLYDKIFNDYLAQLEINNGHIVNNGKNISMVQGLDLVFDRFNKSENIPVIKDFISDLKSITPLNEVYFKSVTNKPVPSIVTEKTIKIVNKSIGIDEKGKIVFDGFADKVINDKSVIKAIKKETLKAITQKQGFQQFKEDLKKSIEGETGKPLSGKLQQYYRNFAYDTFHKVDRINSQSFAKELKLVWFYWNGGVIKTSRYLCIHANGKLVDSRVFSQMNYNKLKIIYRPGISKEWSPMQDLGMHGCRHRVDFVSNEEAIAHPDKIFDIQTISNTKLKEFPIG